MNPKTVESYVELFIALLTLMLNKAFELSC